MNKIYFDLEPGLGFPNFEILSFDKTKNSPSASVLRGKGSLFSAENFTFNDRISVKMKIKKDKIYDGSELTELQKIYKIYSLFRTKGMVFINSREIFNKVFPAIEQVQLIKLQNILKQIISTTADTEANKKTYDEIFDMICKYKLVTDYSELLQYFPTKKYSAQEFDRKVKQYENTTTNSSLSVDYPFLVMLEKFTIRNITQTSDGYEVCMVFSIIEDIFNERIQNYYKSKNAEFSTFYQEIQRKQDSFFSYNTNNSYDSNWGDLSLNIQGIEQNRITVKNYTDPDNYVGNIQNEIQQQNLIFDNSDISEFEIITYNNIAYVPIQGRSKTMKQHLGVGETNFSIKMFFKNDENNISDDSFLQKLKSIQWLSELEQRELKITAKFPFLNAMDFHALEISDIHFSNDTETDGVMVTMIFKCSGYAHDVSNINVRGEFVDESPLHKRKNPTADSMIFYDAMFHFITKLKEHDLEEIDKITIDSDVGENEQYTLLDMCKSYTGFSNITKDMAQMMSDLILASTGTLDDNYLQILNNISDVDYESNSKTGTDIVGFKTIMGYLGLFNFNGIVKLLYKTTDLSLEANNSNAYAATNYVSRVNSKYDEIYDKVLVNMVHSMFPSYAYEDINYYFIEVVKIAYLDFLTSLIPNMIYILNSQQYKNKKLIDFMNENLDSLYSNQADQEAVLTIIMSTVFRLFTERLDEATFEAKVIDVFMSNRAARADQIDPNAKYSVNDITSKVHSTIGQLKITIQNTFPTNVTNSPSFNKIKRLLMIVKQARYIGFREYNLRVGGSSGTSDDKIYRYMDGLDIISLGMLSIFTMNFGISASSLGNIASIAAKKIVRRGTSANSLFNSLPNNATYNYLTPGTTTGATTTLNKSEIQTKLKEPILNSIFGPDFTSDADVLYTPLTSNIAYTDLGNFLGSNSGSSHPQNKIVYKALLEALDFNSSKEDIDAARNNNSVYIKSALFNDLFSLMKDKVGKFKEDNNDFNDLAKAYELAMRKEELISDAELTDDNTANEELRKSKKLELETTIANEIRGFQEIQTRVFDNIYDGDGNILASSLMSDNLKQARYDSFIKYGDVLKSFTDLYSTNIYTTLPTYDIYVIRESNWLNPTSFLETLSITDFFGMDKLIDLSIQYTEDTRCKTAVFSFIDTDEDVKDYSFQLPGFRAQDGDYGSEEADNRKSVGHHYYSKTRETLKIGDSVSIRMGYNNDNKSVFNGVVQSITGGKVKQIVCLSHAAELSHKKFDIKIKDGVSLSGFTNLFRVNFNKTLTSIEETKRLIPNINSHIIPEVKTIYKGLVDYNIPFSTTEKTSNYNVVLQSLAKSLDSLRHFKNREVNTTNLAEGKSRGLAYYDAAWDSLKDFFTQSAESGILDEELLININNVDRDIVLYGIKSITNFNSGPAADQIAVDPSSVGSEYVYDYDYIDVGGKTFKINGSAYVDSELSNQGFTRAVYHKQDTNLFEVLTDIENRSPGTYWDVLENGFHSTLFVGRSNYKVQRRDYANQKYYFGYEATTFLTRLQNYQVEDFNDVLSRYLIITEAVSLIESELANSASEQFQESKKEEVQYDSSSDELENIQNRIIVTTGKNLISNKIEVNSNNYNAVTIKYDGTLSDKIDGFFNRLNFKSKVTLYGVAPLEQYGDRIRELVIEDETIKSYEQALEMAQSKLQMEVENFYSGKVIITFNPDIRYRTEINLHDSVNQMYGSFLVKDFEHKFDSRGAYTIITPMMKVTPNNIAEELTKKAFWHNLFYDEDDTRSDFFNAMTSANIYTKDGDGNISTDYSLFQDLVERELSSGTLIFGDVAIKFRDDKETAGGFETKNMGDSNLTSLKMHPLVSKSEYLVPDIDLFIRQEEGIWNSIVNFFSDLSKGFSALFLNDKKILNTYEQNLGGIGLGAFFDRLGRVFNSEAVVLERLSKNSLLGLSTDTNSYNFKEVKRIMLENNYLLRNDPVIKTYQHSDQNSIGFFNAKAINGGEPERIKNIAKVISNFKICGLVEICSADTKKKNPAYGKKDQNYYLSSELAARDVAGKILSELKYLDRKENPNSDNHLYTWKIYQNKVVKVRSNASALERGDNSGVDFYDEYSCVFYREPTIKPEDQSSGTEMYITGIDEINISFPVERKYLPGPGDKDDSVRDERGYLTSEYSETISVPKITVRLKTPVGLNKTLTCFFFHNVYNAFQSRSSYYTPNSRVAGLRALLNVVNKEVGGTLTGNDAFIFGDFNLSMFANSRSSGTFELKPVPGEVIALDDRDSGNEYVNSYKFLPLISPRNGTTIGVNSPKNSYDNILFKDNDLIAGNILKEFGVFRNIIETNYETTRDAVSDHFPVYVVIG